MHVKKLILPILLLGCSGCSMMPSYIEQGPNSVADSIPMSQPETANKLATICNNVLSSLGPVDSSLLKYLSGQAGNEIISTKNIVSDLADASQTVQYNLETAQSFRANATWESRQQQIIQELQDLKTNIDDIRDLIQEGDIEFANAIYEDFCNNLNNLKTYSTGMS